MKECTRARAGPRAPRAPRYFKSYAAQFSPQHFAPPLPPPPATNTGGNTFPTQTHAPQPCHLSPCKNQTNDRALPRKEKILRNTHARNSRMHEPQAQPSLGPSRARAQPQALQLLWAHQAADEQPGLVDARVPVHQARASAWRACACRVCAGCWDRACRRLQRRGRAGGSSGEGRAAHPLKDAWCAELDSCLRCRALSSHMAETRRSVSSTWSACSAATPCSFASRSPRSGSGGSSSSAARGGEEAPPPRLGGSASAAAIHWSCVSLRVLTQRCRTASRLRSCSFSLAGSTCAAHDSNKGM